MSNQDIKEIEIEKPKKKGGKTKSFINSMFLFCCVFIFALVIFLFLAKSYSPEVDVAIGNSESMALNEGDMDVEIKSVDERLKWIQMEDEMPSVSVRNPSNDIDIKNFDMGFGDEGNEVSVFAGERQVTRDSNKEENKTLNPPKPSIEEVIQAKDDFRRAEAPKQIIPLPVKAQLTPAKPEVQTPSVPSVTKVYLGQYSTLEEAIDVQNKISNEVSGTVPFIKAINDHFIVQLGSFTDKTRADNFITELKEKGYNPKIIRNE